MVALEAQARKAAVPTTVVAEDIGRYPQDVEAAVYFTCLEALQNVGKYAGDHPRLGGAEPDERGAAVLGRRRRTGFDPAEVQRGTGLQGMADRLDAIGGGLAIESRAGSGTSIEGTVPIGAGGEARG